ncbi:MAG: hypothetical protein GWN87_06700, partial [Desulfuromonadales bacterium]|nr:hypothetical protein [Desulfuromonadales bacterium]
MTTVMPLFGPLLALLLLAPVAADDSPQEKEAVCFIAEVRWVALEGGFFGLIADGGEKFLPLNLPEDFKKKGLKVRIRGE